MSKKVHVITYATHSQGFYQNLINNKYNIELITLGYGYKWNGLRDKPLAILKYIRYLPDDDIVIFVDGFDTIIKKPLNIILQRFNEIASDGKTKVLLSKEQCYNKQDNMFFRYFFKYFQYKVYSYKNNIIVNSGLYMGYVKNIKILLYPHNYNYNPNVDQILMNQIYPNYDFIKVDINNRIFFNCPVYMNTCSDACFIQYPGEFNLQRIKRAVFVDYNHCFRLEINLIKIILLVYLYYKLC
tara:strand:- start:829 stop:1551 length:723 start_codon:yes stop_codon:yes gene_type:complete